MNNDIVWSIKKEMKEKEVMGRLGGLRDWLTKEAPPSELIISFSRTEWADITALLNTMCVISSYKQESTNIIAELGELHSTNEHRTFLKFMATQGFFDLLAKHTKVQMWINGTIETDADLIKAHISNITNDTLIKKAECINAKLIPCSDFRDDNRQINFRKLIDELVKEAETRTNSSAFDGNRNIRKQLFVKLRVILHELLANVIEHAYRDPKQPGFAGVYARVHPARPTNYRESGRWMETLRKEMSVPARTQLTYNQNANWLEIYICDSGVGLLHDIRQWLDQANEQSACLKGEDLKRQNSFIKALERAQAKDTTKGLHVLANYIFKEPFARFKNDEVDRGGVTGLVHIDQIQSHDKDFSRIYTDHDFIGGMHPWARGTAGGRTSLRGRKVEGKIPNPAPGTTFELILQLEHPHQLPPEWTALDNQTRNSIVHALVWNDEYIKPDWIIFFDYLERTDPRPPRKFTPDWNDGTFAVLRLPKSTSKNNIFSWIQELSYSSEHEGSSNFNTLRESQLSRNLVEPIRRKANMYDSSLR